MLETTRTAVAAILASDPTVSPEERKARLAPNITVAEVEPLDQILTPAQAVKILGRDRHTLTNWERRGLIRAVRTGADRMRITGFTASSIRALLAGKPIC